MPYESEKKSPVVDYVSRLIQYDTTNTGDPATTVGEAEAAWWVQEQLEEVGYECEYIEAGAPGRANVFTRLKGSGSQEGALLIHGHLDVVPAVAKDWSVPPFSGAIKDGYVWGRGAVDMKGMVGMMVAVAKDLKRSGFIPQRDIVWAFFSDEEAGSDFGSVWIVQNRPDVFAGVTEAIGEVGGFSLTLPTKDGGHRRFYTISTGEKGIAWLKITAHGTAGHGSFIQDNNPIHILSHALTRLCEHEFPVLFTDSVKLFFHTLAELTTYDIPLDAPDLTTAIAKLGSISRIIGATLRDTANPTMLEAGYKANVVPQTASAVIDCRILPGRKEAFEKEIDRILGPDITREWIVDAKAVEYPFTGTLIERISTSLQEHDPEAVLLPYLLSAGTDAKALDELGITCYGFTPLKLPEDIDFTALFHGVDERVPVESLELGVKILETILRKM